ncbi:hypothetical protein C8F01DRAFT_1231012 [Mycena amicta]|nr:hypothetical protein C8F01DRAFT_1231012 [Mycena amicta]
MLSDSARARPSNSHLPVAVINNHLEPAFLGVWILSSASGIAGGFACSAQAQALLVYIGKSFSPYQLKFGGQALHVVHNLLPFTSYDGEDSVSHTTSPSARGTFSKLLITVLVPITRPVGRVVQQWACFHWTNGRSRRTPRLQVDRCHVQNCNDMLWGKVERFRATRRNAWNPQRLQTTGPVRANPHPRNWFGGVFGGGLNSGQSTPLDTLPTALDMGWLLPLTARDFTDVFGHHA